MRKSSRRSNLKSTVAANFRRKAERGGKRTAAAARRIQRQAGALAKGSHSGRRDVRGAELAVKEPDDRWRSVRIWPYKTTNNGTDDAVLAFMDIDHAKASAAADPASSSPEI